MYAICPMKTGRRLKVATNWKVIKHSGIEVTHVDSAHHSLARSSHWSPHYPKTNVAQKCMCFEDRVSKRNGRHGRQAWMRAMINMLNDRWVLHCKHLYYGLWHMYAWGSQIVFFNLEKCYSQEYMESQFEKLEVKHYHIGWSLKAAWSVSANMGTGITW